MTFFVGRLVIIGALAPGFPRPAGKCPFAAVILGQRNDDLFLATAQGIERVIVSGAGD